MANEVNHLWHEFYHRLRGFILQRVNNPADADDILQDVFLRIHQRLSTVREDDRLVSWMFQIARNAIIDYYRAASRRREIASTNAADLDLNELNVSLDGLLWKDDSPTLNQEIAACLQPMLEQLPESYQQAINLVEIQGVSQRVAAETLGLSFSGAKSRVQRGRQKLKAMLLECCQVQLDSRGNVLDYKLKEAKCNSGKKANTSCC